MSDAHGCLYGLVPNHAELAKKERYERIREDCECGGIPVPEEVQKYLDSLDGEERLFTKDGKLVELGVNVKWDKKPGYENAQDGLHEMQECHVVINVADIPDDVEQLRVIVSY